jgi:hypothetical protein
VGSRQGPRKQYRVGKHFMCQSRLDESSAPVNVRAVKSKVRNETPALPKRLNVNSSPVGYPCGAHTPPADSSQSDRLPADRFDLSHGGTSVRDSVQIPRRADRPRPDRPGRKPSLPLYIGANSPNALCNRGWNLVFSRPTTGSGPGSFAITRLVEFRPEQRFRPVEASKPGLSFASTV